MSLDRGASNGFSPPDLRSVVVNEWTNPYWKGASWPESELIRQRFDEA